MRFQRIVELMLLALGVVVTLFVALTIEDFSHVKSPMTGGTASASGK